MNKRMHDSFQPQILGVEILKDGNPALFFGGGEVPGAANGPADALDAPKSAAESNAGILPILKPVGK